MSVDSVRFRNLISVFAAAFVDLSILMLLTADMRVYLF